MVNQILDTHNTKVKGELNKTWKNFEFYKELPLTFKDTKDKFESSFGSINNVGGKRVFYLNGQEIARADKDDFLPDSHKSYIEYTGLGLKNYSESLSTQSRADDHVKKTLLDYFAHKGGGCMYCFLYLKDYIKEKEYSKAESILFEHSKEMYKALKLVKTHFDGGKGDFVASSEPAVYFNISKLLNDIDKGMNIVKEQ